jgi:hypothetical protein
MKPEASERVFDLQVTIQTSFIDTLPSIHLLSPRIPSTSPILNIAHSEIHWAESHGAERIVLDIIMTVEERTLQTINSKYGFRDKLAGFSAPPGTISSVSSMKIDMERLAILQGEDLS